MMDSLSDEEPEPPPQTLAWLTWHARRTINKLDLATEEKVFAIDKGGKVIDFAMKGFWAKHKRHGIRHVAPAAACAYALAWLEQWAKDCETAEEGDGPSEGDTTA